MTDHRIMEYLQIKRLSAALSSIPLALAKRDVEVSHLAEKWLSSIDLLAMAMV